VADALLDERRELTELGNRVVRVRIRLVVGPPLLSSGAAIPAEVHIVGKRVPLSRRGDLGDVGVAGRKSTATKRRRRRDATRRARP
jgi:hypothetical protein